MKIFTLLIVFVSLFVNVSIGQNLLINEVMTSNATNYEDEHGDRYDWIEIYNAGDSIVNLDGYYLSDDVSNLFEWKFGEYLLAPKEYVIVWASGEDIIASSISPDSITGLQCWFRATDVDTTQDAQVDFTDNSYKIKLWNSRVGSYSAKQTTEAKKPTYVTSAINGKPAVRFDGTSVLISDLMPPTGGDPRTIIVVEGNANLDSANTNNNNHILHYGAYGIGEAYGIMFRNKANNFTIGNHYWQKYFYTNKNMDKETHLISAVYEDGVDQFFVDGSDQGANHSILNTVGSNTMRIGSRIGGGSEQFAGDIAEILVYNTALSSEKRSQVENYLAEKYAMPRHGYHTNFKLNSTGETITLTAPDGTIIHQLVVPELPTDVSYGVSGDGLALFAVPTPNKENNTTTFSGLMSAPLFSVDEGFYTTQQTLTLESADPDAVILYTLDGSDPDTSAINGFDFNVKYDYSVGDRSNLVTRTSKTFVYSQPIVIAPKTNVANDRSQIPAATKLWDTPTNNVPKATIVKAAAWKANSLKSEVVTKTYIVEPDVDKRFNLPVISIVTPDYNLFDYDTGMYVPGAYYDATSTLATPISNFNQDTWERAANFELFDTNGDLLYDQKAGIRIHGNFSANWKRKSFRLEAHSEYQSSSFKYELFPGLKSYEQVGGDTITEYNAFLVRNSGNNWDDNLYLDAMVHRLVNHLGVDGQASRAVVHYVNGEYWGIMNLREKQDATYFSKHYEIKEKDVVIINARTMGVAEGEDYEYEGYNDVERFVNSNTLTDSANFAYLNTQIDIDNYLMHFLVEIYVDNTDFLGNNRKMWKKRTSTYKPDAKFGHDGRWRWLLYDTDQSFATPENDRLTPTTTDDLLSNRILRKLLEVDSIKTKFINSFCDQMNTTFEPERVVHIIDSMHTEMDAEMAFHIERWNCPDRVTCIARDQDVDKLLTFANNRPHYMREHLKSRFTLADTCIVTIDTLGQSGTVKLNSILIDRDLVGIKDRSKVYPWNGVYFKGVPMTAIAIADKGCEFVKWNNGSTEDTLHFIAAGDTSLVASFRIKSAGVDDLIITEVNYETPGSENAGNWIEIYNKTDNSYLLNEYAIGTGMDSKATINGNVRIEPKGYYVLCSDIAKFKTVHPEVDNCIGIDADKLSFTGQIMIMSPSDAVISFVDFVSLSTAIGLTDSTSLELSSTDVMGNVPENWHNSYCKYGTPGDVNSTPAYAIVINEFMASNSATIATPDGKYSDWIELYNPLDVPVDIAGLYLTDDASNKNLSLIPIGQGDSTIIAPKGFMLIWADGKKGIANHADFKLSASGETIGVYGYGAKKQIDIINFDKQPLDISYGLIRDAAATWVFFEAPTPKATNNPNVGVDDYVITDGRVLIYPNPTEGIINIACENANQIAIFSTIGECVWSSTVSENVTCVDSKQFDAGIYFVRVHLDNEVITQKVIVK